MARCGALLPFLVLLTFGLAFSAAALGGSLPAFDDHPGQLFRLWHALSRGLLPWEWNPDWWAGYPELQFYPPGYVYMGALIYYAAGGLLSPAMVYQVLLWIIYLLPGMAAFWFLARILPDPWLALPGAFVALTLSAGARSGVEEGLRWGLIAARLGWGLLPLLALSLVSWQENGRRPLVAAPLLAGIVITHPAHAPAGVALVLLAALFGPSRRPRRLGQAIGILILAAALTAFWSLPLIVHLKYALPLAWGEFSFSGFGQDLLNRPLLLLLLAAYAIAWVIAVRTGSLGRPSMSLLVLFPTLLGVAALDALALEPLGLRWLPADRVFDDVLLALILGASVGTARFLAHEPTIEPIRPPPALAGLLATALFLVLSLPLGSGEPTLTLWPKRNDWPNLGATARGLRLPDLWAELRKTPSGRVLFIRSAVPLGFGREWWRPHTHITALTPLFAGRQIINGTFTHPSPIAGLVYTGSADNHPLTRLVERHDGRTLFGRPLETVAPDALRPMADRLGISTVVALEEDRGRLPCVEANPRFAPPQQVGPFLIFQSKESRRLPDVVAPRRFRLTLADAGGGWVPAGIAFYPLWRAQGPGGPLPVRADRLGMLEVKTPAGGSVRVEFVYRESPWEWAGTITSALAVILWAAIPWIPRTRG